MDNVILGNSLIVIGTIGLCTAFYKWGFRNGTIKNPDYNKAFENGYKKGYIEGENPTGPRPNFASK